MDISRKHVAILFPLMLLVVTLVAYWPTTRATFIWDDDAYITDNTIYNGPTALSDIWFKPELSPQYYPMVFTSFYLEKQLYGLNPVGYHVVNIVLHAGGAALLWLVLAKLRVPGAKLAAALFALHPVMTESVAWVTERKNTLSVLLMLASLLAFLHFGFGRRKKGEARDAWSLGITANEWGFYGLSLVAFAGALLSKSVACGLAPVLVLLLWWKRPRGWGLQMVLTLPYWIMGAVAGWYTAHLEKTQVGASGPTWDLTWVQKVLLASRAVCFYAYKLLLPINLSFYYNRWEINPAAGWQWVFPVLVVAALVAAGVLVVKWGRGPLVALLAFLILLFPALGFFKIYPFLFAWVADHFAYHASVAFFALLAAVLTLVMRRYFPGQRDTRTLVALPLLVVLGAMTYLSSMRFTSYEELWRSVIAYDEEHPHWNAMLGMSSVIKHKASEARRQGNEKEALALNEEAMLHDKEADKGRPGNPLVYNNLAGYYLFKHEPEKALELAQKAVAMNPADARLYGTLAQVYTELGEKEKALETTIQGVKLSPRMVDLRVRAARALMEKGNLKLAQEYVNSILQLDPDSSDGHLLQGQLLAMQGEVPAALRHFRAAMEANPENYEALDSFAKAVVLVPTSTPPEIEEAFKAIGTAVKATNGTNTAYLDTLGFVLARMGRVPEAVTIWQEALPNVPAKEKVVAENIRRHLAMAGVTTTGPATATAPATAPGTSTAPASSSAPATTRAR